MTTIKEVFTAWDGENAIKHSVEQGKAYALPPALLELVRPHESLPYNSQIADEIIAQEGMTPYDKDKLKTLVFLARKAFSKERRAARDASMLADGWQIIPSYQNREEHIPAIEYRGAAMIRAKKHIDWMTSSFDTTGKIVDNSHGHAFFIPKGRRTRGYAMQSLDGYYKPITNK